MQLAIARVCKDVTSQPTGTSSSSTSAKPQGQSLASLLSRPMSPLLPDTAINVLPELPSSHIEELEEIEIHEQPLDQLPPS